MDIGVPGETPASIEVDPDAPDSPELAFARQVVADRYGTAVSEKCTPRFLRAHGLAAGPHREAGGITLAAEGFLRSGAMPVSPVPTVLTFSRPELPPASRDALARVLDRVPPAARDLAMPAYRQAYIRARRSVEYRRMGMVYSEVERVSERSWLGRGSPAPAGPLTEVCWLSSSLRTRVDPLLVADAAADPDVVAIDVAEPLRREAGRRPTQVVGAEKARTRLDVDGSGVLVGVLDGEVARSHPAFGDRVVHRRNFTGELWGSPEGHGTAVAGLVGAAGAHPGMAPGCEIYNYKIFASVSAFGGTRFDGERALQAALEDGVQVANCSWAVGRPRPGQPATLLEAVNDAWDAGMVIVKSAGNKGSLTYPGEAEGILAVGTTTADGARVPPESGRSESRPHVVAPGGAPDSSISSLLVGGGFGPVQWGTSFAAPLVAGAVALLLAAEPALTPDEARDRIVATAKPLGRDRRLDLSSW